MKANTIMALKKVMKEMVEKEVAKQINIVIDEMKNPTAQEVTAKDVHQAAEDADMEWDDDKNFMSLSKRITNKTHIDDMTSSERAKLISAIKTESIMDDADYYTGPEPAKQQLAKDPTLNKILNETKGGISQGDTGMEPYPTMGGGVYDTNKMNDVLLGAGAGNTGVSKEMKREIGAVETIKKAGVSVDQVPQHVKNKLTRDYSSVMKAIDKKKSGEGFRP